MTNVIALHGGPTGAPEVNPTCVEFLEAALEQAKSGEIVGVAMVCMHHDGTTSRSIGGFAGGFAMIGALHVCITDLMALPDE